MIDYTATMQLFCQAHGLPMPEAEYRFAKAIKRNWRFDFAWPAQLLALEVEGGAWTNGRHVRGAGFLADCEKYNYATLTGWRILRYSPQQLRAGAWVEAVKAILEREADSREEEKRGIR